MPRKPRKVSSTDVYHIINRGINKKILFHTPRDFQFYLGLLREYTVKFKIQIYHYCLMRNHTHLLIRAKEISKISLFGHYVQRRYAYYYSKTHNWSGQVFKRRYLGIPIENDTYLLECGRYIDRNPIQAKMVKNPEDYPYCSYKFYAYEKSDPLITPSPTYLDLSHNKTERASIYRFYISQVRAHEKNPKNNIPF